MPPGLSPARTYFITPPHRPLGGALPVRRLGRRLNRLDYKLVTSASAQVAGYPAADLVFVGIGVVLKKLHRRENHSGCAVSALQALILDKRFLNRMQLLR